MKYKVGTKCLRSVPGFPIHEYCIITDIRLANTPLSRTREYYYFLEIHAPNINGRIETFKISMKASDEHFLSEVDFFPWESLPQFKPEELSNVHKCTCPIQILFNKGCQCGGI